MSGMSVNAAFPEEPLSVKELFLFRDWQAVGVTKIFYYFMLFFSIVYPLTNWLTLTIEEHWTGFFSGFFLTLLLTPGLLLISRLVCEVIISLVSIRDNVYKLSTQASGASFQNQAVSVGSGFGTKNFIKDDAFGNTPAAGSTGPASYSGSGYQAI